MVSGELATHSPFLPGEDWRGREQPAALLGSTASTRTLEKLFKRPNLVVSDLSIGEIFVQEVRFWPLLLDLCQSPQGQ